MTATHCPYCALQCGMRLNPAAAAHTASGPSAGRPTTSLASPDPARTLPVTVSGRVFPTNRGGLCQKGWTSASVLVAPDRLTTPLVRGADGELHPAGWIKTLDHLAERLRAIRNEHGADAVAVFGGGGLTNEKAYQLGKFARLALGTANIDYNGRFCMSSAAAAANRSLGLDRGLPFPVTDLDGAQAILLVGSNPAETMPPFVAQLAGARARGGLVVVDPRRSATAELAADGAGVHLQPAPGTDLALLLGLSHVVVAEGLADDAYLAARTSGLERMRGYLAAWWPERTEQVTGVPAEEIRRVARLLAEASPARGGAGAGSSSRARAPTARRPRSTSRCSSGSWAESAPDTGRSPARATARAGASTARRPTSSPGTARSPIRPPGRTLPGSGGSTPPRSPGRANPPSSC
jgi:assimilatory nitrate reductase catalytic subunit